MPDHFAAFLGVSVLVIVTPGPDTALTTRNTLFGGRRGGMFTAVGVSTGQATWALAASAGVITVLQASEPAFIIVRTVGAAYLIFLGAQALLGTVGARRRRNLVSIETEALRLRPGAALRQGLLSNLTNPKMAVFFTSLLPQFAPSGSASFSGLLLLGLVFSAMTLLWLSGYACAVAKVGDFLRRPRIKVLLECLTGSVLIALGLRLVTEL